jgi:hypothetical protein
LPARPRLVRRRHRERRANTLKLTVTVSDDNGSPLQGASVTVADAAGSTVSTTTDSNGVAQFFGLAKGDYSLRVAQDGFATVEYPNIHIKPRKKRTDVEVTLSAATIDELVNEPAPDGQVDDGTHLTQTDPQVVINPPTVTAYIGWFDSTGLFSGPPTTIGFGTVRSGGRSWIWAASARAPRPSSRSDRPRLGTATEPCCSVPRSAARRDAGSRSHDP